MRNIILILIGFICSFTSNAETYYCSIESENGRWCEMYYIEASGLWCCEFNGPIDVAKVGKRIWWTTDTSVKGTEVTYSNYQIRTGYVEYWKDFMHRNGFKETDWDYIWENLTYRNVCWVYIHPVTKQIGVEFNIFTDVNDIQIKQKTPSKIIKNGQIVIIKDGIEYNLLGQKL